jgi:hypothetical protein
MKATTEEQFSMLDPRHQTQADLDFAQRMEGYYVRSMGTNLDKLRTFTKYVPRQTLTTFVAKNAVFEHVLRVHGHIIECGVFLGAGLFTWGQLSAIYEPYNHHRRVVGFDTFTGFTGFHKRDGGVDAPEYAVQGGLATSAEEDIREAINLFDLNRPIGHIPRIELIVGDAVASIPNFIEVNPHLVVAMLYLDFDLYEPTKVAIETFLPRMPKGAILAFDELNQAAWPGETQAVLETVGIRNLKIQRFPFSQLSFALLE